MRLFIKEIRRVDNHDTFTWTSAIEGAWNWDAEGQATRYLRWILGWGEITVKSPTEFGKASPCTDFRVEPRPQGGFALSCKHPLC
jgi:hypothetical protein